VPSENEGSHEELDVNPLICAGDSITAVDALIVMAQKERI
jgi:hypothetical protein